MKSRRAGIILSYTNTFLNMLVGLFLSSFLLRMLGDTEYGVYQTMASFANYLVLLEFGTGTVMTRNLSVCRSNDADEVEINKNAATIWGETCLLVVLILIVSAIFYFSIDFIYANSLTSSQIIYGRYIFIFVTLYLVFSFCNSTLCGIVLAFEQYTYNSIMSIARQVLRVFLLVVLILNWKYSIIIAIVDFILSLVQCTITYIYCRKRYHIRFNFRFFDRTILKSSLPLSIAIFIQGLSNQANSNVDKFVIGIKIDPETVALYTVAMYIFQIFSSLGTVPISMYTPQIARSVSSGLRGRQLVDSIIQPCRLVTIIGGTVLFGFISVGREFITIVYGSAYLEAWTIALIVSVPMCIYLTNGVMQDVLNVMNLTKPRTISLILTTVVNIVLTVIWIDKWGIVGAASATAVSTMIFQVTLLNVYYDKALNMNMIYLYRKAYKGILIYQVIGAVAALILTHFISNTVVSFLAGGTVYVLIFALGFILFGANDAEKNMMKSILSKIFNHK
ncbi:MAG: oligosaccharide flippase family protein [Lachnospiraceae bacterium]|nr:oligosaccharide flippase family protein [Lachnospiraceae bacterium]